MRHAEFMGAASTQWRVLSAEDKAVYKTQVSSTTTETEGARESTAVSASRKHSLCAFGNVPCPLRLCA